MTLPNLSQLSFKELSELEEVIKKEKADRDDMRVYRVTFDIGFLSKNRGENSVLHTLYSIEDFLVNEATDFIEKELALKKSSKEGIVCFDVIELEPKNFPEAFKK
jgi:hypothetical protein